MGERNNIMPQYCLFKGTVLRDFLLLVFFMNQFPPVPEYPIRTVLNFFENSWRYSLVKVHHWYQRHRRQNCCRYTQHRRQICHQYQRHRWQILAPVSLVLLIRVANLPPVSTIPAANLPLVSTTVASNDGKISGC
jgi:hypothetical protein